MKSTKPLIHPALLVILVLLSVALFGFSIYKLTSLGAEYQEGEEVYDAIAQYVEIPDPKAPPPPEQKTEETSWPEVDFAALRAVNPEVVAWLICEGTQLNYPLVQGNDNAYYLKHLFDGTWNSAGCLFVDCGNTPGFLDQNTVVYGHNMKNKSMFSILTEYKSQEFYDAHPRMLLLTPDQNFRIELFAGYVAGTGDNAWQLSFASKSEFGDWIEATREKSLFQSNVEVEVSDRLITLSTCSYEFDDARYILIGKLSGY